MQGPDQCTNCNTDLFVSVNSGVGRRCLQSCLTATYLPDTIETGKYYM